MKLLNQTLMSLRVLILCVIVTALFAGPSNAQSVGFDTATLRPFVSSPAGDLFWADTVEGKVRKVAPAYRVWVYRENLLSSNALAPEFHERVIKLVRKAAFDEKVVDVRWTDNPGFSGGFVVYVSGKFFRNALQIALLHIQNNGDDRKTIDQLTPALAQAGLLN